MDGCSLCSFSVCVVFLFFQVILSSKSWKGFQKFSSLSVRQVLDVMFKSRADATAKTYIRVIKKSLWTGVKVGKYACSYLFL